MTTMPSLKNLERLPLPSFYNPKNALDWDYRPDIQAIKAEAALWRKRYGIKPAAADKIKIFMMLVDMQKDFLHKLGALYVGGRSGTGAPDDACRTVEFIYHYLYLISLLVPTMDTHVFNQIFHPMFIETADGGPVSLFANHQVEDWESGKIRPTLAAAHAAAGGNLSWLTKQCAYYSTVLRQNNKMPLTTWPEHCILGTEGHAFLGIVQEALMFHSVVRGVEPAREIKGGNLLTENYSIYGPEVTTRWDGGPIPGAQKNTKLLMRMSEGIKILAGQAGSHCVAETGRDYKNDIGAKDPKLLQKVFVLEDCMSPVTVPDGKGGFFVDCTPLQEKALAEYRDACMHVVKSTDALSSWQGFNV